MPNILLRDLLEGGFCNGYDPSQINPTPGRLRFALDVIARIGVFTNFNMEGPKVELCNHNNVPYGMQPFFHRCLDGLFNNSAYFNPKDLDSVHTSVKLDYLDDPIEFSVVIGKATKTFIEPVYDYVSMQSFMPMHSIIAAYLMGISGEIDVDCVSVTSGLFMTKKWPIIKSEIEWLLSGTAATTMRRPGGACMSCDRKECTFKAAFDAKVYDWMKAKHALEEIEAQIREHITYNGPTKVGAHLVYLKENKRRDLDFSKRFEWLELLKQSRPHDWMDFLKPDSGEIFRLAAKGKISKDLLEAFKESRYYTLDTTLTL